MRPKNVGYKPVESELRWRRRLGNAIRSERLRMGLSQAEVTLQCRFGRTTLSALERGKHNPTISTLWRIAQALDCDISDFIEIADNG